MNRLLITGAAGALGTVLRNELRGLAPILRLSDIKAMPPARDGEEVMPAELADFAAVERIMAGVDAVVHLGGIALEDTWDNILQANIVGCYNVWETARRHGVKRIVFASSNHAIGMYPRTELLDSDSAARPDTFYGLGKAFGELLGRMYFDKHGIEAACLRIGSCFPKPKDARMLSTWLSYADFAELCRCCLTTPLLGYAIVYGVSANERCWWDNRKVSYIGFRPKDSAEPFAAEVLAGSQPDPTSPTVVYQGGSFAANGYTRT